MGLFVKVDARVYDFSHPVQCEMFEAIECEDTDEGYRMCGDVANKIINNAK